MRGPFLQTPPPLVVNLGRGHMPVTEQLLHLDGVHPGIQQQRRPFVSSASRMVIPQAVTNLDAVLLGDFRTLTHVG